MSIKEATSIIKQQIMEFQETLPKYEFNEAMNTPLSSIDSKKLCDMIEKTGYVVMNNALSICRHYLITAGYKDELDLLIPQCVILYSRFPELYQYSNGSFAVTRGDYDHDADMINLYGLSDRVNLWNLPVVLTHEMMHRYQYKKHYFDNEMRQASNDKTYGENRRDYTFEREADDLMNTFSARNFNTESVTVKKLITNDIADLYTIFALRECRIAIIITNNVASVYKYSFIDINDNNEYYLKTVKPQGAEQ